MRKGSHARESRRRAAQHDRRPRPQPRARGPPHARRRRGRARSSSCCPRSGRARTRRADRARAPSRSTAPRCRGRARSPRGARASTSIAGSIAERVDGEGRLRNTSRAHRPRRRAPGHLPQDPHVRRRGRGARLPRVRPRGSPATRSSLSRPPTASSIGLSVCYDLRFPELYRDARRARRARPHRPGRLHARHHARPLGGPAAGARDRGPGVRGRGQPDRRARDRARAPAGAR